MKMYGVVYARVQIHIVLISALVRGDWSALTSDSFTLGERSPYAIDMSQGGGGVPETVWMMWIGK
jgi:hypothetical protein